MTTAHDIERSLYDWAPRELAMAWDNVGLLVGDPAQEVRRVLVALDITQGVAEEAVSLGAQMIVSHHPVMNCAWHEVQTLRADAPQGAAAVVTPQEYAGLRETLLFDVPHARYSKAQLDYAAEDLDFYRLEQGYALGCAAVRRAGQLVEELLPDARMLPALAAALGAGQYPVKTPGHGTMNCMAKWLDGVKKTAPIWLAFDFD